MSAVGYDIVRLGDLRIDDVLSPVIVTVDGQAIEGILHEVWGSATRTGFGKRLTYEIWSPSLTVVTADGVEVKLKKPPVDYTLHIARKATS